MKKILFLFIALGVLPFAIFADDPVKVTLNLSSIESPVLDIGFTSDSTVLFDKVPAEIDSIDLVLDEVSNTAENLKDSVFLYWKVYSSKTIKIYMNLSGPLKQVDQSGDVVIDGNSINYTMEVGKVVFESKETTKLGDEKELVLTVLGGNTNDNIGVMPIAFKTQNYGGKNIGTYKSTVTVSVQAD